ncbi:CaiB/BaiF CoA transferase family protein [Alteromonas lipolytica]|uniref:CoA transferase n=1 Tax=Alteromonas lipolytica TaxID=1856405 RepID=A0A1E8FC53_9ALTE|nr:CoA transferase [Alteromonas lipolytica]OFI33504.1 hypothetical protein BFC17_04400 [Alteromonas lipolytica]GGF59082.1 CoA transferase [Alteromonas lipolytica]
MSTQRPLDGIRVVDFSWAIVGNTATKLLGDFGAEILKVESWSRRSMERMRDIVANDNPTSPDNKLWFAHIATSKKSITPELKDPRGRKIIEDLIREADVVVENFSPGTLARMGFGYDVLRELNPKIILASGSIFGQSGPMSGFPGVDATGAARSGRIAASGYPDGRALVPGLTYGDSVLPFFIASGVMAALERRDRTGQGCWIDGAMQEVLVQQMWPLIDASLKGNKDSWRTGNRHADTAPHNVYPLRGEDKWLAIEVWDEQEWQALCEAMDRPELFTDKRFASVSLRKANEDELDSIIAQWTASREQDGEALMYSLQAAGIAAGVVRHTADLVDVDPQLKHRGFLSELSHPVMGTFGHQRTPITLTDGASSMTHSPLLGQHTEQVCKEILGMSDEEIATLAADGVFGNPG